MNFEVVINYKFYCSRLNILINQSTKVLKCRSLVLKITFDCAHEKRTLMEIFWYFLFLKNWIKQSRKKSNLKFHHSTQVTSSVFLHLLELFFNMHVKPLCHESSVLTSSIITIINTMNL